MMKVRSRGDFLDLMGRAQDWLHTPALDTV
jgi:hypothetical protein